jgi:hypothetical protein
MKALPHRLRDGRCRDCGQYDLRSAPDTCTRCAIERMTDHGYEIIVNPVAQFIHVNDEMWRVAAHMLLDGSIKSGSFYLFVGHNDGGSLGLPMGDMSPAQWEVANARVATETAEALTQRYPQVWVVTTVGCWNAVRTGATP